MAKKQQKGAADPTPATPVNNRDALQRLSYLYQASVLLSAVLPPQRPEGARRKRSSKGKERTHEQAEPLERNEAGEADEQDRGEGTSAEAAAQGDAAARPAKRRRQKNTGEALKPVSRHLAQEMVEVAKKATIRIDPAVKRTKCKGCGAVLVPGLTSTVRIKPSGPHAHLIVHTCLHCHSQRRLPAPPHLSPAEPDDAAAKSPDDSLPSPPRPKTKREQKDARRARPPVFFEREGHVSIRGNEVVRPNEYGEA
ncbi:hypothetical protein JCM6882_006170 [Rhodosporidiobolus microsporus]